VGKAVVATKRILRHMSLVAELRVSSDVDVKKYLQMTDECFQVFSHLLKLHTEKQSTRMRRAQEEKRDFDFFTLEDRTDTLSRNVGKRLPLDAA
jgi:hypothetical protein